MEGILKRTWAEIDLDVLAEDYRAVRSCMNPKVKLCCVIKADAYGHGAVRIAEEFESLGADFFGVSNLEEALQLRLSGIRLPILIMGYTPPDEADRLAHNNISQCVFSLDYAKALSAQAVKNGVEIKVHIKIDTGMNRIGMSFENINRDIGTVDEVLAVCALPGLYKEGLFTHFAVADEGSAGMQFTMQQYSCFKELLESLQRQGVSFELTHCANSAGVLEYPLAHRDMVRAGIIIFGLYPSGDVKNRPGLRPVLSLKSVVSHVKTIHAGSTVSYGRAFTAAGDMQVATVPIGYADGYPRILGNRGAEVLLHGRRCKILGRVCMDQLMVDATGLENVKSGDIVTLIGRDGGETILADELAVHMESINYEVVCDIGKRVPRVYLKGGKVDSVTNQLLPAGI